MKEKWRDIPGYEGLYQASNLGRIKAMERTRVLRSGTNRIWCRCHHQAKILKLVPNQYGYQRVGLHKNGRMINYHVHVLILLTFVGPCPQGMEVRHFPDNSRTNNKLSNLQWGTKSQNQQDRTTHGTGNKGEKHPGVKLKESDILAIRAKYAAGKSLTSLGFQFEVSLHNIYRIVNRKTWKHIA